MVASQPAIQLRILLPVTINAETHLEINPLQAVLRGHIPVTFFTIQPSPIDVRHVPELYMVGHKEGLHPPDRVLLVQVLLFLHNPGMCWNDMLVAVEAFFHGRQSGMVRPFNIRVAEAAIDLLHPGMNPVAEWNRLLRPYIVAGEKVIEIKQQQYEA
jgi:hypothetical protein